MTPQPKPRKRRSNLRLHNDGQDFICMDCGSTVRRTRDNPYPEHNCPEPMTKPKRRGKGLTAKQRRLIHAIAQEAHTMGRLYTKGGEIRGPGVEFERVEAMVLRYIRADAARRLK